MKIELKALKCKGYFNKSLTAYDKTVDKNFEVLAA
jgi:hypothetical protein